MLTATTVTNLNELHQIHQLNLKNLKSNVSQGEQQQEGFVTWAYPLELLEKMHQQAPSVIIKDGAAVAGYALTLMREARSFHKELELFLHSLETLEYKMKPLAQHSFYCMGQICIDKNYRGKGLVNALYQKHKELYSPEYDFILTEISPKNERSMNAHAKVGFQSIHRFHDAHGEWDIMVWDWQ
jgi:hypothetical protein